jgi:hypothetical protein
MVIAIIVLSILLAGALAFIFWLLQLFFNTYEIIENAMDIALSKTSYDYKKAYDGKYYPATVISQIKFNCDSEMVITDFSMYEDKKIVGFTIYTKESMREYMDAAADDIPDEILEEVIETPTILKNVIVYAPMEGMWTWKSQE